MADLATAYTIVTAPVGTVFATVNGPMAVAQTGYTAVGASATLTSDGAPAAPQQWCQCRNVGAEVSYYERWTAFGQQAHGWVHADATCRQLVQSG